MDAEQECCLAALLHAAPDKQRLILPAYSQHMPRSGGAGDAPGASCVTRPESVLRQGHIACVMRHAACCVAVQVIFAFGCESGLGHAGRVIHGVSVQGGGRGTCALCQGRVTLGASLVVFLRKSVGVASGFTLDASHTTCCGRVLRQAGSPWMRQCAEIEGCVFGL